MRKEKSCGCIVFDSEDKVLLVQMRLGHWSFPKGHVEADESEEETALRETLEETNITCKIISGFREVSTYSPYPDVMKDVIFFVARPVNHNTKRQVSEISKTNFYTIDDAKELITYDNDLDILGKAVLFLKKAQNI